METLRAGRSALDLTLSLRDHGLGWIELRPRRGATLPIPLEALRHLDALLEEVEARASEGVIRMLIVSSPAPFPTYTGYDLEELLALDQGEIVGWSSEAHGILRRLEQLSIPSIAAIQGEWLGGAAELGLACSYRVLSDTPGTHLGFPQTQVGTIPSWGGTVRLPRLVGLQSSLQLVLTGEPLAPTTAMSAGVVDRLISSAEFEAGVEEFALRRLEQGRLRTRGGRPIRRRLLDDTAPGRRLLATRAAHSYLVGTDDSDAGRAALRLMCETVALPLDGAFRREAETAGQLRLSPDAQGRLHSQRYTERARLRIPIGSSDLEAAAVLGASHSASELAYLLTSAGTHVRMKESRKEVARTGVGRTHNRLQWDEQQGRISAAQAKRRAARVEGVTGYGGFGTLDVVVAVGDATQAGVEEVLGEVETHVGESCLLTFHDWTASPTRVQRSLSFPERVVGIAPSFPADRFTLMEIVPGTLTSPESVSTARRLARRLALTAVVVSDQTPTPGTRLLAAYIAEGARLVEEGAPVDRVDSACEEFGMALGPLKRSDAIGAGRSHHLLSQLAATLGPRFAPPKVLDGLAASGDTFYKYRSGRPAGANSAVPTARSADAARLEPQIRERILLLLINEATLILEEGSVTDPGDLEIISLLALGFPRARGGILFYTQAHGAAEVARKLHAEAARSGERYSPSGLLRDLAASGRGFFGSEGVAAAGHTPGPVLQ